MSPISTLVAAESIAQRILLIRGHRTMLDADLAELYGVETRALNQAVRRNIERFPGDFMFQLTNEEKQEVITNCDHLARLKFSKTLPYAFTEHGALMPGNILRSERAVEVSLLVVRTFVQLREMLSTHKELAAKLEALERKIGGHDQAIAGLIDAIRQFTAGAEESTDRLHRKDREMMAENRSGPSARNRGPSPFFTQIFVPTTAINRGLSPLIGSWSVPVNRFRFFHQHRQHLSRLDKGVNEKCSRT